MPSDSGDITDDVVVERDGDEVAVIDSEETVELAEILFQYRGAILDLDERVRELEARPQFAASIGKKTRL